MSTTLTARLLNVRGRVTLHECVRLELDGSGSERAIYPIYRCTETGLDREFGCLNPSLRPAQLSALYPDVPLVVFDEEDGESVVDSKDDDVKDIEDDVHDIDDDELAA